MNFNTDVGLQMKTLMLLPILFEGITQLSSYYTKFSHPDFDEMNLNNTHKVQQ